MKATKDQRLAVRAPRQERALQKVELILEAAIRLLDKPESEGGGLDALTTNAVAEKAGVSIGTLYQYFPNKAAILDALAERDGVGMSERVMAVMQDPAITAPRDRVARIMAAVTASLGERRQAQRIVMQHSLSRGMRRLAPLFKQIVALLAGGPDGVRTAPLTPAEAYVLTHAVAGVLRAMISAPDGSTPPRAEIEEGLVRLLENFVRVA